MGTKFSVTALRKANSVDIIIAVCWELWQRLREHLGEEEDGQQEDCDSCCDMVTARHDRGAAPTRETPTMWLPEPDLHCDNTIENGAPLLWKGKASQDPTPEEWQETTAPDKLSNPKCQP